MRGNSVLFPNPCSLMRMITKHWTERIAENPDDIVHEDQIFNRKGRMQAQSASPHCSQLGSRPGTWNPSRRFRSVLCCSPGFPTTSTSAGN
jgi:hypothetical protein